MKEVRCFKGRMQLMSIDMYLSEVRSQTNSAVQLANAYSQAIGALADSCHAFMRAPQSGNTYDSAKLYFTTVYPPLVNGVTMVCDALTEAHQKFPNEFESSVDTCDVKESELSEKIAQGGQVLKAQYAAIDSLEKADPALERSIMRTQAVIAKLEETRKYLYEFNASSAGIFSEVESLLSQLNQGIAEVGKGSAWNASTGTFELDRMSLSWIQPLNEKWNTRNHPKMDSERNEELKKYTLIKCYDEINDSVTWSIEHNGKRLDNAELQAYLKKVGEYLDESDYDILKLSPKEWETRINNQWKHGTEYFNGTDVPWFYQGLGHIQDFVGKRQSDGTWDLIINFGYVYAFNKLQSMYKVGVKKASGVNTLNPELQKLHGELDNLAEKHLLPQFSEIDPNLEAGYTGSFKTGTVGNPNKSTFGQPIDLTNYDIDFYIKSDVLYELYGNSVKANPQFREILSQTPGFEGLKPNKQGFSIKFLPSGN
nr:hypothetical protein [uncultured Enterococcus sp.]